MKTEAQRQRDKLRRQEHVERALLVVEIVRRLNHVTLRELRDELKLQNVSVCDRTLRRDLDLLYRLRWVTFKRVGNCTKWYWNRSKQWN